MTPETKEHPTMEAGRELDALVARKAMGLPIGACRNIYWPDDAKPKNPKRPDRGRFSQTIPHYSTDIAAAWEVVEQLWELGFALDVGNGGLAKAEGPYWRALVTPLEDSGGDIEVYGRAPAHVICLAALRAVGEDV